MKVTVRERKNKKSTTLYLDIYFGPQKRSYHNLGIKIYHDDSREVKNNKKRIAQARRVEYERQLLQNNSDTVLPSTGKKNFVTFFEVYLDSYKKKDVRKVKGSLQKFKIYIENLNSFQKDSSNIRIGKNNKPHLPFNKVTTSLCEGFKDFLLDSKRSNLTGETPNDYWKRFKGVVKSAYQDNYLSKNPTEGIVFHGNKGKSNRLIKDVLSMDEIKVLAKTQCGNPEVKRAFLFSCFTGLGESEIRKLTWGNIKKFKNVNGEMEPWVVIERSKNSEQISVKLHKDILSIIGNAQNKSTKIFTLPSNVTVSKYLKRWVKDAEIDKNISFYCGRHSFAVNLLLTGTNIKTVADNLGHSSLKYVSRYLNHVNSLKSDSIDNLGSIF